jgi:RNA:NAD 2'-phosphotransferase (TPT1/KptA family)
MADLAELRDMVEGLRAAAHKARQEGNRALADALEKTRFEIYERYIGELQQTGRR